MVKKFQLKQGINEIVKGKQEAEAKKRSRELLEKFHRPDQQSDQDLKSDHETTKDLDLSSLNQPIAQSIIDPVIHELGLNNPVNTRLGQTLTQSTNNSVNEKSRQSLTASTLHLYPHSRIPNFFLDDILPTLQPSEQLVLLRMLRLSFGFNSDVTDAVGVGKLASKCNLGESTVKLAIKSLERLGFIEVLRTTSSHPSGGNRYRIVPHIINNLLNEKPSQLLTGSIVGSIKEDEDDPLKEIDHHQREVMMMYESITANKWKAADSKAYEEIKKIPLQTIEQAMRVTKERAMNRPNSLKYFIKEILSVSNPTVQSKTQRKQAIGKIVERVRTRLIGVASYSTSDFIEDCKRECAREGVMWDNDLFNEVAGF